MAVDMTIPIQDDQEEPEPSSTNTSNGIGWVNQQSPPAPSASVANLSQHKTVSKPLTPATKIQQQQQQQLQQANVRFFNLAQNITKPSERHKPILIVYDIDTLLKLRQAMDGNRVELRINPAALAEKVFKDSGNAHLTHQRNMFSRGLSSFTRRSTDSDEELTFQGRSIHQPLRQPRAPPRTPHAQQNEGFARFLSQYASPPHHRVTAGGRIVPAGPLSPPPMLTLRSIQGLLEKQSEAAEPSRKINRTRSSLKCTQIANTESRSGEFWPSRIGNISAENLVSSIQTQGLSNNKYDVGNGVIQPLATGTYGAQPVGPMVQLPSGPVSTMVLQDGSTIYSMNGLMYRSYWNETEMVLEPLNVAPTAPVLHDHSMPGVGGSQAWFGTQSTVNVPTLLGNAASGSQAYRLPVNQDLRAPALQNQFADLQSRLSALDKHMALHLHELPPAVHATLVAQRKELVEQLDNVRVSKEQFERSGSTAARMFNPYPIANIGGYQHTFGPQGTAPSFATPATTVPLSFMTPRFAAIPMSMESAIDQTGSAANNSWGAATNKGLSPDAPAFIPSFAQRTSSESDKTRGDELNQHNHQNHANIRTLDGNKTVRAATSGKYEVKDSSQNMVEQMHLGKTAAAHRSGTISSPRSSSQDVLPVVSDQEAEYVDRLGLNPENGPGLYCRVPADFQEVIRRAREQATLYGCLGGQSKDPAYDAEQDIRWAMSDSEPIPLPKKIPDHIAEPRPWNWDDSAYNYRVIHHTNHGLENGASRDPSCKRLETEANRLLTLPSLLRKGSQAHQQADSWERDHEQSGWLDLTSVNVAEGGPSVSIKRRGLEDTAASRGPLSTTSGNVYPYPTSTKAFTPNIPRSASEATKSFSSFNEVKAQVETNENINISRPAEQQPETPRHRQYHAYVESYPDSPLTPRNKSTTLFVPAEMVKDNSTYNDQMPFEESKSGDDPNSWGPVTEQKDNWEPDRHPDHLSIGSWSIPSQSGKQDGACTREKPATTNPAVKLPASTGHYPTESRNTSRPTTSTSEHLAAAVLDGIYNASNNEVRKKKVPHRKNKSVDSSSTTSNKSKHDFLRGMLDSALYSSARADKSRVRHARYIPASEREPVRFSTDPDGWEEDALNKQNLSAGGQHSNNNGVNKPSMATRIKPSDFVYSGQDARAIKAPYSVASSTYHAQGYMPQYDGAGNRLALKANCGFAPQYQGPNDQRIASHASAQANPHYQYSAPDSFNHSYRDSRNEQNPGRDSSVAHYGREYLDSF